MKRTPLRMPDEASAGDAGPGREVLLSRVLDQVATPADWNALDRLAMRDATVWRELALSLRQQQDLVHAVACAGNQAEMIDLEAIERADAQRKHAQRAAAIVPGPRPATTAHTAPTPREHNRAARLDRHHNVALKRRLRTVLTWSGWLAAAAVALVAVDARFAGIAPLTHPGTSPLTSSSAGESQATLIPSILAAGTGTTSSHALREYLRKGSEEGTVLGEMPRKILMQAQPASDGNGYEIVYIRQILERTRVNDIYRFSQDEAGRATPVPIQFNGGRM